MQWPTDDQVELYRALFQGRSDVFARYWEKNGRSGYSPAYSFNWNEFLAHKERGGSMKTFENKKLVPLTPEMLKQHLFGRLALGVYPILPDNTSLFLAADFDGEHWLEDANSFMKSCAATGLFAYLERSKSGAGGHVWLFFALPYPCYKSRRIGLELIRRAFNLSIFEKEVSFDRLFPNQDSVPAGGFGNLIALPLQGCYVEKQNTLFIDPNTAAPYSDQWTLLASVRRHTTEELDGVLMALDNGMGARQTEPSNAIDGALQIRVGKHIEIPRANLTPTTIQFLKEKLNFLNTEYLTKKRLGKSVYQVQKYFKLVEESGDDIFLPRGFLNQLIVFLQSKNISFEVHHEFPDVAPVAFKSLIQLTQPQEEAVKKALTYDQGVIVAPPGSGKTMIGMELVARRHMLALVLVHRRQLLDQWVERIQTYLDIPKIRIGRFSGTTKKIGKEITVGLLQSLARRKDSSTLENTFGTIIIDECHHIPAKTFREVIANLNPRYLYGLTATPKRKHNDEQFIFVYIGDTIVTMAASYMSESEALQEVSAKVPKIIIRETNLEIPFQWKTDRFQLLAKIISFDTARNRLIADDIIEQVAAGNKLLVLSERKEHLEILALCLKGHCETIVISGDDSMRQRTSKIKQINDGHYQVILSTGQFFGEGLDVKNISVLVLAFPFSFEGKLAQYIGRLLHGANPKFVFDYQDAKVAFLERQFKQRKRYYNKLAKSQTKT
ncbi:MAG: hypothetical protein A3A44_03255 [Candidatus Sungbacteria bacterium RIFCSPLOWO2_01_FULL_60_25]|uniref:Helicase ATP-binding domain-containing protein n=2 Tax=Candidatus Sungiibacteriota TaxID=1817917 RepID=A0A1G2LDC0_9BACT|nr:MAG: hypothetical protein A3A44_03255 [Candidatus Sungbacteria bacterium RIFCSPLOWO2_01_FULL_60_25]